MKIKGIETRSIWPTTDGFVEVIDQTKLPHGFGTVRLTSMAAAARAISTMIVRGAPLIGATGAYGLALACATIPPTKDSTRRTRRLLATRPTAVNLRWALDARARRRAQSPAQRTRRCRLEGSRRDLRRGCRDLPAHRRARAQPAAGHRQRRSPAPLNILTHCNAGWLACVDWGTALAPIYMAHDEGIRAACLGGRDAAAQPGRLADRVRAWRPWRAAHRSSPTMPAATSCSTARSISCIVGTDRVTAQRRRRQQDRHLSEGARGEGQRRAVLCGAAVDHDRLDAGLGRRRSRSRSAAKAKSRT